MKNKPLVHNLLPQKGIARHLRKMTLRLALYYPEHERRSESVEFRHTKFKLLKKENRGCFICGTHEKLEVHHFYIEWALMNAVDWDIFLKDYPQFSNYNSIEEFVDSPDNMMILCQKHHRHRDFGIHMMDFPEWRIQKFIKKDFKYQKEEHDNAK